MTPVNLFGLMSFLALRNFQSELKTSPSSLSTSNYTVTLNKTIVVNDVISNLTMNNNNETVENGERSSALFARHAHPPLPFEPESKKDSYYPHHFVPPLPPPIPPLHFPVNPPIYPPVYPPVPPLYHPVHLPPPHHQLPAYHLNPKKEYEKLQVGYGTVLFNGKDAVLKCHFPSDTYIISNVVWHKQDYPNFGEDFRHFERTHGHISMLSINDVNPKDFGIYTCVVTGGKRNAHPISLYQEVHFFPSKFLHHPHPYGRK